MRRGIGRTMDERRRAERLMDKLVIFDLDGTLLETNEVDTECYAAACRGELDVNLSAIAWSDFAHITDSAIAEDLLMRSPRRADAGALERMKLAFFDLLSRTATLSPQRFRPVAGAESLVARLSSTGWKIAIATGACRASVEIKIAAAAGFLASFPISTADDHTAREDVVRHAMDLAAGAYSVTHFTRVTSVGDGPWDVRAAHRLSLPFVGVGRDWRRDGLLACGASCVLDDLQDFAAVAEALDHAVVPDWTPQNLIAR
jgi:phosphoglycolate phosphatase-like HAD superfamily hydrolase